MSASASLGLSLLWDTDGGLSHVDKYTYSSDEHIKVDTNDHPSLIANHSLVRCPACHRIDALRCPE